MGESASRFVLMVASGTGGHLYPGIATARALVKGRTSAGNPVWEVVFVVRRGDMGKDLLLREGFRVIEISGQGWPRHLSLKTVSFPFVLISGFMQAWSLLGRLKPDAVIGMGGYLSFPVLLAARLRRISTMIHEQNVYPGMSNRALGRWVKSVAVSFEESKQAFPSQKVWLSGLPVRPEIGQVHTAEGRRRFKLAENKLTFLIFGGSQGAHRINEAVIGAWPMLSDRSDAFQVLHVTGPRDYGALSERYRSLPVQSVVIPYCHDMAAAYAAADFVICRAGASTIVELIVARKPALLVPFPFASENHQFYNAEILVKRGVAELIPDTEFTSAQVVDRLRLYFRYPERIPQMRERLALLAEEGSHGTAAQRLADYITATL